MFALRISKLSVALAAAISLSAFSPSRPVIDIVCQDWLPEFEKDFERYSKELAHLAPATRALADVRSTAGVPFVIEARDRRYWAEWSEKMLSQSNQGLDILEGQGPYLEARNEISKVATRWVEFRGYSESGRLDRMKATLASIRISAARARRLACP